MALAPLDFPPSPTVGQLYPDPPVTGQPTYKWDGAQWLAYRASGTPGLTVPAAPFDALAYNGMQVNGSMEVSQELGQTGRTTSGYFADGWIFSKAGTMAATAAQASTIAYGINNSLMLTVQTAQTTMGAGDFAALYHVIEGYRVARLGWGTPNAQPLTIGFWSRHHRTGVYSVSFVNGTNNYSYATTYTHNAADFAQYNTITIPGPTSGTWAVTNTIGLQIFFTAACGTTFSAGSANVWGSGYYYAAPGQVNGVASTSDIFLITGVVVLPGIEAPTAAQSPLIMRPFDQELVTCQRYFQLTYASGFAITNGTFSVIGWSFPYPVTMRAIPAVSLSNTTNWTTATLAFNVISVVNNHSSVDGWNVDASATAAATGGTAICLGSGYCISNARL